MIYLRFIITLAKGVFDLQIDKKKKNTKLWKKKPSTYIVKIFYMWMLFLTLKERNTKQFVQNWHSPKSPSTEWSWFFIELVLICYAVGLLQYSKSVWSKVGTLTVYMLISCFLMPENCFRSGKSCKMYAIFTMFSSSEVYFQHF
jgi:hypothetical protein